MCGGKCEKEDGEQTFHDAEGTEGILKRGGDASYRRPQEGGSYGRGDYSGFARIVSQII